MWYAKIIPLQGEVPRSISFGSVWNVARDLLGFVMIPLPNFALKLAQLIDDPEDDIDLEGSGISDSKSSVTVLAIGWGAVSFLRGL